VASYATLLTIVARLTGCRERELTISFGDVHIYEAHFDAVQQQIERFNHAYMMYDRAVSEREAFVPSTKASMDVTVSSQYDREAITPELYMDESGVIDSGNYRMFLWPERVSVDIAVRNYDPMAAIKAPLL
jgi:thymidylate synthase